MYKLCKTFMLIGSIALFAFSCDPNPSSEDKILVQDFINFKLVDSKTGSNLVDTTQSSFFHPDSISFLDSEMNDLNIGFGICSPDTLPEYVSESLYPRSSVSDRDQDALEMPEKTYYLKLSSNDLDTIKLSYGTKGEGPDLQYIIMVEYNGIEIDRVNSSENLDRCGTILKKK